MLWKTDNDWHKNMISKNNYYYDDEEPDEYEKSSEQPRADLITIHIYKDQIVKLTEDVIRWIFHKIKGAFKRKKKGKETDAGRNKEKKQ